MLPDTNTQSCSGRDARRQHACGRHQRLTDRELPETRRRAPSSSLNTWSRSTRSRAGDLRDDLVPRESQRECERALFTLRRLRTRFEAADLEPQFVPVRTHEGDAPFDFGPAAALDHAPELILEISPVSSPRAVRRSTRLGRSRSPAGCPGQRRVGRGGRRRQPLHQAQPAAHELPRPRSRVGRRTPRV